MAKMQLEIVSPDKMVYQAEVSMVIVRSTDGELGILPHHLPLITGLVPHVMRVKIDDREELIAVAGGFMEVQPEKVTILASAAETPIEIDVLRAQQAYQRAKARIDTFHAHNAESKELDFERAKAALDRAVARLKATNHSVE